MISDLLKKIRLKWYNYKDWKSRIHDVIVCPDNLKIARVKEAGLIDGDIQVMHNGLKIALGSYYGTEITKMLQKNKGVHEPQEEFVFSKVLEQLKEEPVMVELGSYWAFYSMWLLQKRPKAKVYLYEPDEHNLSYGKKNFELNGFAGDFNHAFISHEINTVTCPPTLNLPYIFRDKGLEFIDILHSDIQGYELNLLDGARNFLKEEKIGYLFLSTHDNKKHGSCINLLKEYNYEILCEADLDNTFSYDGLIVAKSLTYQGIAPLEISRKAS
jgi:hypothetical protein